MSSTNLMAWNARMPAFGLAVSGGSRAVMLGHLRARPRFTRTIAVFKQCAWCGGVAIRDRCFLSGRIPVIDGVLQVNLFSWLLLTIGVSHGICRPCADGIRHRRAENHRDRA